MDNFPLLGHDINVVYLFLMKYEPLFIYYKWPKWLIDVGEVFIWKKIEGVIYGESSRVAKYTILPKLDLLDRIFYRPIESI